MANILTVSEAANALRCAENDPAMLDLLPLVDASIDEMTGHAWEADTTISPLAKAAARILIVQWHEDPGMVANRNAVLPYGMMQALMTLAIHNLPDTTTTTDTQIGTFVAPTTNP